MIIKERLKIITNCLFPRSKKYIQKACRDGKIYVHEIPSKRFALWQCLIEHLPDGAEDEQLALYFSQLAKNDPSDCFKAYMPKGEELTREEIDHFYTNIRSNLRRYIIKILLEKPCSDLKIDYLACNAYIETDNKKLKLVLTPKEIINALEKDIRYDRLDEELNNRRRKIIELINTSFEEQKISDKFIESLKEEIKSLKYKSNSLYISTPSPQIPLKENETKEETQATKEEDIPTKNKEKKKPNENDRGIPTTFPYCPVCKSREYAVKYVYVKKLSEIRDCSKCGERYWYTSPML